MTTLASITVLPLHAQVALVDATWQDYPQWETGDELVAFKAPSLTNPDHPPYPGFAVATCPDVEAGEPQHVVVELWSHERPRGLELIHSSLLSVGLAGVEVGSVEAGHVIQVDVPRGSHALEIWTDSKEVGTSRRVAFVLPMLSA